MNYHWNWSIFWEQSPDGANSYLELLLSGLLWTVATALCAWLVALVLGTCVGVARTTRWPAVRRLASGYVELFRNVPLLVQLFLWYFVLPELLPQSLGLWLKQLHYASFVTAVVGLGLFMSARVAEQIRAGIESIPPGQRAAATALGLTGFETYRHVLLPLAFRIILPPLTSELLNTVKNTSTALTIGLLELTAQARSMQEFSFQVFEAFTAATVLYLAVNLCVVVAMRYVERRFVIPGFIVRR
jgi:glutamate/aspartate transport system permease protein